MIKPEDVPKDSAEVVIDKLLELVGIDVDPEEARIIVAAALNAWPGMKLENLCGWVMDGPDLPYVEEAASLILPLTEPSDD